MFDALKRRKQTTKSAEEQRAELQVLIDTSREEAWRAQHHAHADRGPGR